MGDGHIDTVSHNVFIVHFYTWLCFQAKIRLFKTDGLQPNISIISEYLSTANYSSFNPEYANTLLIFVLSLF